MHFTFYSHPVHSRRPWHQSEALPLANYHWQKPKWAMFFPKQIIAVKCNLNAACFVTIDSAQCTLLHYRIIPYHAISRQRCMYYIKINKRRSRATSFQLAIELIQLAIELGGTVWVTAVSDASKSHAASMSQNAVKMYPHACKHRINKTLKEQRKRITNINRKWKINRINSKV